MLQRNLLSTGVTRGKKLVVLVGQKKAVAIAVRNVRVGSGGRSSASGYGRLPHDSSAWRVEPGSQGDFLQDPRSGSGSMASSRTGRCLPYSLRVVQWRRNDRCTARELVNRKDGRLTDDADLVVRDLSGSSRRLCGIPGRRPTPPPNVCRLRGTPPQVSTSAAALRTASDGRHGQGVRADWSGASHSRSRTARHRTPGQLRQRAGSHAPPPAGPTDAARPNRTLSAAASNAAPTPPRPKFYRS